MEMANQFIPDTISIKNFNNIRDLDVKIDRMLVITGKNGSGKTSVAEAIDFCLTGQIMRGVSINDVTTFGETTTTVEISGTYNGSPITITRERKGKSQKIKVITGDEDNRAEIGNPGEFLEGIVSQVEFEKLYYISGHSINTFVDGTTSKTSEMLDKLFSIHHVDAIARGLSQGILDVEKKLIVLKATIETLEKKKEIHDHVKNAGDQMGEIQRDIDAIKEKIIQNASKKEEILATLHQIEADITPVKQRFNELSRRREDRKSIESKRSMITRKITEETKRKEELEALMAKIEMDDDLGASIDQDIARLQGKIMAIDKEVEFIKDFPSIVTRILDQAPDDTSCPVCLSDGKRTDAIKNLESVNASKNQRIKDLLVKKISLKEELTSRKNDKNNAMMLSSSLREIETSISAFKKMVNEMDEEVSGLERFDQAELDENAIKKETMEKEANSIRLELGKIDAIDRVNNERLVERESALARARNVPSVEWTTDDENVLQSNKARRDVLETRKLTMIAVKNGFKEILSSIRERIMATINPGIMQYIKRFGRNQTAITSFEIVPVVRKRGAETYYYYDFKVEVDGNEVKFDALSTGQKALALISVILNMINVSSSAMSLIIIDEIDNCGLDKDNMRVILKALVNVAASTSKVLFINRDGDTIRFVTDAGKEKEIVIPVHEMKVA